MPGKEPVTQGTSGIDPVLSTHIITINIDVCCDHQRQKSTLAICHSTAEWLQQENQQNNLKPSDPAERSDRMHSATLKSCCTFISSSYSECCWINQGPTQTYFEPNDMFYTLHYKTYFQALQGYRYIHAADMIKCLQQCKCNSDLSKHPIFCNQSLSIPAACLWQHMTKITCSIYSQNILIFVSKSMTKQLCLIKISFSPMRQL